MSERTWTHDPSHYPEPMTPLSAGVWFWAMGVGIQAAARELRAPFGGFDTMTADGGWAYECDLEPGWEPDPGRLERAALEVAGRWREELRPRSEAITEELRALRPERGTPEQAAAALDRLLELVREQWRIHFLAVVPVHAAREVLFDAYVRELGAGDDLEPYRLIEGIPNETLAADERLWRIARLCGELDVADVVLELPARAALGALGATHHGREVLAALGEYLRRYGGRSRLHELSEPREAERPELVLESVRLFLERPRDLPAERAAKAAERAAREAAALDRIGDPAARRAFAAMLERVVAAVELEESHAYTIDYPGLAATREALLGFGRRLVAEGRLDASADVFLLERDELREAVADGWGAPLQPVVAERAAALERARRTRPRPFMGPPPSRDDVPPMVAKFYGVPGTATHDGDVLRGTGASAGSAVGVARVVRSAEDFGRLGGGDVLVCTTTTPAWTPLFASIAGLVTDAGGTLSHAAVVAREYKLPAVVGTDVGTQVIPDGATISVDGASGEVRILRR
jgi:pyruvate,water dikinase